MPLGPLRVVLGKTIAETEGLYRELEARGIVRMDVDPPADGAQTPKHPE